jgi:hypothetical protein
MSIAKELSVGTKLDAFDVESLQMALQAIAEFLDCDSLVSVDFHDINK